MFTTILFRNHDLVHSNTLDLHELHVNEAIQVLDNVLEERRKGKVLIISFLEVYILSRN